MRTSCILGCTTAVERVVLRLALAGMLISAFSAGPIGATEAPSRFEWTGSYIGGHIGGQWLSSDHTHDYTGPIGGTISSSSASFDGIGFIGGGQIGYNWQFARNYVVGIEADVAWAHHDVSGVVTQNPVVASEHYDGSSLLKTQGSVRGRLGYTGSPWLLYLTGGVAFGSAEVATSIVDNAVGSVTFSESRVLTGWTVGSGLDYLIAANWLFGIEYRYTDLGSISVTTTTVSVPTDAQPYTATADFQTHDVRVRLSYLFDFLAAANR